MSEQKVEEQSQQYLYFQQYSNALVDFSKNSQTFDDFNLKMVELFQRVSVKNQQPVTDTEFQTYVSGVLEVISKIVQMSQDIQNQHTIQIENKLAQLYLVLHPTTNFGTAIYRGAKIDYRFPKFDWYPDSVIFKKQLYQSIVATIIQERNKDLVHGSTSIKAIFEAGTKINSQLEETRDYLLQSIRDFPKKFQGDIKKWRPVTDLVHRFYLAMAIASFGSQILIIVNQRQGSKGGQQSATYLSDLYIEMMLFSVFDIEGQYITYYRAGDTYMIDMFSSMPSYLHIRGRFDRLVGIRRRPLGTGFLERASTYFIIIQALALTSGGKFIDQSVTVANEFVVYKSQAQFENLLLMMLKPEDFIEPAVATKYMNAQLSSFYYSYNTSNIFQTLGSIQLEEHEAFQLEEIRRAQYFYKMKMQLEKQKEPNKIVVDYLKQLEEAIIYFQNELRQKNINQNEHIFFMDITTFYKLYLYMVNGSEEFAYRVIKKPKKEDQKMIYTINFIANAVVANEFYQVATPPYVEQGYFGNQAFKRPVLFFNKSDNKFYRNFDDFKSYKDSLTSKVQQKGQGNFEKNIYDESAFKNKEIEIEEDQSKRINNRFLEEELKKGDWFIEGDEEDYVETYNSERVDLVEDKTKIDDVFEDIQLYYNYLKYIWVNNYEAERRKYAESRRKLGSETGQNLSTTFPLSEQFKQLKGLQSIAILASLNYYFVEADDFAKQTERQDVIQMVANAQVSLEKLIEEQKLDLAKIQQKQQTKVEVVDETVEIKTIPALTKKTIERSKIIDLSNIQIVESYLMGFRDYDIYQQIQKNLFFSIFTQLYTVSDGEDNVVDMQMIKLFMESSFDRLRRWRIYIQPFMDKLMVTTIVSHSINLLSVFKQLQANSESNNYTYFKDFPLLPPGVDQEFLGIVEKSAAKKAAEKAKLDLDNNNKRENINQQIVSIEQQLADYQREIISMRKELLTKEELLSKQEVQRVLLEERVKTRMTDKKKLDYDKKKKEMEQKTVQLQKLLTDKDVEISKLQSNKTALANVIQKDAILHQELQVLVKDITAWYTTKKKGLRISKSGNLFHQQIQQFVSRFADIKNKQLNLGFDNNTVSKYAPVRNEIKSSRSKKNEILWSIRVGKQYASATINNLKSTVKYNDQSNNVQKVLYNKVASKINSRPSYIEENFNGQIADFGGTAPNFRKYEKNCYDIYSSVVLDNPVFGGIKLQIDPEQQQRLQSMDQRDLIREQEQQKRREQRWQAQSEADYRQRQQRLRDELRNEPLQQQRDISEQERYGLLWSRFMEEE